MLFKDFITKLFPKRIKQPLQSQSGKHTAILQPLTVNSKVRLSGGYDYQPKWLGEKPFISGFVLKFIPGQNSEQAAVIQLNESLTVDEITGNICVLELRYVGATWTDDIVCHVELCNFLPEDKTWKDRRQGIWVESHASCRIL